MADTVHEATFRTSRETQARPASRRDARPWWKVPPVDRSGLVWWIVTFVVMTAVVAGLGWLVVHELGAVRSFDDRVARWFPRHATPTWDDLSLGGSFVADADVKIPAVVILCGLFTWLWRRWTEAALLAGALALEASAFTLASLIVDRPRPPIPHLDAIPPTGAFPSGHSAAAVAFYGAIAIVVCWHTHNRLARTLAVAAAVLVPPVVGLSRMYRGMHHPSDVVVGLAIGLVALWITWRVVRRGPAAELEPGRPGHHDVSLRPAPDSRRSPGSRSTG